MPALGESPLRLVLNPRGTVAPPHSTYDYTPRGAYFHCTIFSCKFNLIFMSRVFVWIFCTLSVILNPCIRIKGLNYDVLRLTTEKRVTPYYHFLAIVHCCHCHDVSIFTRSARIVLKCLCTSMIMIIENDS